MKNRLIEELKKMYNVEYIEEKDVLWFVGTLNVTDAYRILKMIKSHDIVFKNIVIGKYMSI